MSIVEDEENECTIVDGVNDAMEIDFKNFRKRCATKKSNMNLDTVGYNNI